MSGYVLEDEANNSTKLTIVSINDMKGIIPRTILEMVAARAP